MKRTKCTAILMVMLASSAPAIKAQVLKLFTGPDLTSQYCGGVPDCFISDPLYLTGINNQGQLTGYWFTENGIHRVQSVIVNAASSASADLPSPNSMRAGFMWASKINEAGQVVGFVNVEYRDRLNRTTAEAWIPELIVAEAKRSTGVGKRLLAEAERVSRERGCWGIALESATWREDAHRFYEREGWNHAAKAFVKGLSD